MAGFIRPASPIEWSASTAYDALTLVADSSGNGYVSKKAVPQGTQLTNAEYWVPVKPMSGSIDSVQQLAQEAKTTAESAQDAAEAAQSTATSAQSTANTAKNTAEAAQGQADDALDAAKAAQDMTLMQQGTYPIE